MKLTRLVAPAFTPKAYNLKKNNKFSMSYALCLVKYLIFLEHNLRNVQFVYNKIKMLYFNCVSRIIFIAITLVIAVYYYQELQYIHEFKRIPHYAVKREYRAGTKKTFECSGRSKEQSCLCH